MPRHAGSRDVMKPKHPLSYAPPPKSQIRDWRNTLSWPLVFVAVALGVPASLWPNHRELWALAGAFAFTGVIARYAS
jgi:hypothetical protein